MFPHVAGTRSRMNTQRGPVVGRGREWHSLCAGAGAMTIRHHISRRHRARNMPSRCCFLVMLLQIPMLRAQLAHGPAGGDQSRPNIGWVTDHTGRASLNGGSFSAYGDSRFYLVEDYTKQRWDDHKYVRLDLRSTPLEFTLDLSKVPCGCLACVYMVQMDNPRGGRSNYCGQSC